MRSFLFGLVLVFVPTVCAAQARNPSPRPTPAAQNPGDSQGNDNASAGKQEKSNDDPTGLRALGFGVALSLRWNVFSPDIVSDATVDPNGVVRVSTRANTNAGFMLESHYLPWRRCDGNGANCDFGGGVFVAAQPGSDSQIISAIGMGIAFGWKVTDTRGFVLGVGYAAIPAAKVLGDEFVENQPAPKGADGKSLPIRLQTRDKGSVLLLMSFVF